MYRKEVVFFDDNEFDFIEEISINIDNALVKKQEIPNERLVSATKELIRKYNIDFDKLMNMLENNKSNYVMWELNRFDSIFEISMVSKIEEVLFETFRQLAKNKNEE